MKNKIIQILLLSQLLLLTRMYAQNIAINSTGNAANAAAILDLTNTASSSGTPLGLLVPRTSSLPTSLTVAAQGLLFYNTNTSLFNVNTSTSTTPVWAPVVTSILTNTLTNPSGSIITSTVNGAASSVDLGGAVTTVWSVTGNAITTGNFLGTIYAQDLIFKTNSTEDMRILNGTGNTGIGTIAPVSTIDVNGTFGSNIVYLTSSSTAAYTIGNTSANVFYMISGNGISSNAIIYLPTVTNCACYNRRVLITNAYSNSFTIMDPQNTSAKSPYINLSNTSVSTINANTAIELIADKITNKWLQIK